MNRQCSHCVWYDEYDDHDSGWCRRYPPSIVAHVTYPEDTEPTDEPQWPLVEAEDYCGEFAEVFRP